MNRKLIALALVLLTAIPTHAQVAKPVQTPTYFASVFGVAAAASKDYLNMFNASGSGKIVRVTGVYIAPANTAAVTGSSAFFTLSKSSTVGTTCTSVTVQSYDSTNAAVPSQITANSNCTTDPTISFDILGCATDLEETRALTQGYPCFQYVPDYTQPIVLREGQGLTFKTTALAPVGLVSVRFEFTIS